MFGLGQRVMLVLLAAPLLGGTLTGHAQALPAKEPHKLGDVTMGRAVRETPNEAVKVKLSQPSHAEIDLAGQVLFPTQHSLALIDAARTGHALFQARVYDGPGKGRKVYDTTAFIGTMVEPGADPN